MTIQLAHKLMTPSAELKTLPLTVISILTGQQSSLFQFVNFY